MSPEQNLPRKFWTFEIRESYQSLPPGQYLLTGIPVNSWIEQESDLSSPVRLRLAAIAQKLSESTDGEPFSLTFIGQSIDEFAIFKIDQGAVEERDLYWFDPKKHPPPPSQGKPRALQVILDIRF